MWTKENVKKRVEEINKKGFIPVPENMYRNDDGIVGQILEREFGVEENNLHIADLGTYELKGMRLKKKRTNKLTLFHQTSTSGLSPLQLFDRFSYVRPSKRNGENKRKLFTTIKGTKENNLGLILKTKTGPKIDLYYKNEYLSTWDLTKGTNKIDKVLLVLAETEGKANTKEEKFHFVKAFILSSPKDIGEAIKSGAIVMELCIDQPEDASKAPHDRGPHIRIPLKKLNALFENIEQIL